MTRELTSDKGARTYDYTPDGMRLGARAKIGASTDAQFRPYEHDAQGSVYAVETAEPMAGSAERYRYDPYGGRSTPTASRPRRRTTRFATSPSTSTPSQDL